MFTFCRSSKKHNGDNGLLLYLKRKCAYLLLCSFLFAFSSCGGTSSPLQQTGGTNTISPLPVPNQGRIYVNIGSLYLFSQQTGIQLGSYTLGKHGNGIDSDPVIFNGIIYVIGDTASGTHATAVYALREQDGSLLWQTPLDVQNYSLTVANGLLYVCSSNHTLFALRTGDGIVKWQATHLDVTFMAVAGSRLYVATPDSSFLALNALTGTRLWQRHLGGRWLNGLDSSANAVYVSGQAGLFALDASNGNMLWHITPAKDFTAPVFSNGIIYTLATNGILYALQANTGQIIWRYTLPAGTTLFGKVPLIIVDNTVLIAGLHLIPSSGTPTNKTGVYLTALGAEHGNLIWQRWPGGGGLPALSTADGVAYIIAAVIGASNSFDNTLYAFQVSSGKLLWQTRY